MKFKKALLLAMSTVVALSLAACGTGKQTGSNDGGEGVPNPFTEYQTLVDAEQEAGFELHIPSPITGYDEPVYRLDEDDKLLEAIFENDENTITFRKAAGDGDISGNYNVFPEVNEVELDGVIVTLKGAEGQVNVAIWDNDGFAYSVSFTTAIDQDAMIDHVKTMMG